MTKKIIIGLCIAVLLIAILFVGGKILLEAIPNMSGITDETLVKADLNTAELLGKTTRIWINEKSERESLISNKYQKYDEIGDLQEYIIKCTPQALENSAYYVKIEEDIIKVAIATSEEEANKIDTEEVNYDGTKSGLAYVSSKVSTESQEQPNYKEIIGEWIPSKARLQNGEAVSLNQLWGSSINYGGTLNIYMDGTYTEYIGAYAEVEPLEGVCKVDDVKLKLLSNTGKEKEINVISENEIEINYNDFFVLEEYKNCVITFKKYSVDKIITNATCSDGNIVVPYINIATKEVKELNDRLKLKANELKEFGYVEENEIKEYLCKSSYTYYLDDEILSILIQEHSEVGISYSVYNIDLINNKLIDTKGFFSKLTSQDKIDLENNIKLKINEFLREKEFSKEYMEETIKDTLNSYKTSIEENNVCIYYSEDGKISAIVPVVAPVVWDGGSQYIFSTL